MVGRQHAMKEGQLDLKDMSHFLGVCLHACGLASPRIGPWVYGETLVPKEFFGQYQGRT